MPNFKMNKILYSVFLLASLSVLATGGDSLARVNPFRELKGFGQCDACGCSASGGSMGFASMIASNFVGIRYFNQYYQTNDGLYSNSPWYKENFNTLQVWARIPVYKTIQVSVLLPYQFHERETATGTQSIKGIGDATVLGQLSVFKTHSDSLFVNHQLQVGLGVKIPLGEYREANMGSVNPGFQVGTGSWDMLLSTEYVIRRKALGLNAMANYAIKGENDKNYRFGNQLNYAATLFYVYEKDKWAFAPQLGLSGEVYESNYQHDVLLRNTKGDVLFSRLGLEAGYGSWSIGTALQLPINEHLMGGLLDAKSRWSINVNYKL